MTLEQLLLFSEQKVSAHLPQHLSSNTICFPGAVRESGWVPGRWTSQWGAKNLMAENVAVWGCCSLQGAQTAALQAHVGMSSPAPSTQHPVWERGLLKLFICYPPAH